MKKIIITILVCFPFSILILGIVFMTNQQIISYFGDTSQQNLYNIERIDRNYFGEMYTFNAYIVIEDDENVTFHSRNGKLLSVQFRLEFYDGDELIESVEESKIYDFLDSEDFDINYPYKLSKKISSYKNFRVKYSKNYEKITYSSANFNDMIDCPII